MALGKSVVSSSVLPHFPKAQANSANRAWLSELFLSPRFGILPRFGRSTNTLTILSSGSPWLRKEKSGHPQWPSGLSGPWSQALGWGGSWRSLLTVQALFDAPRFLSKALQGQHDCRQAFVPGVSIAFFLLLVLFCFLTKASQCLWTLTALLHLAWDLGCIFFLDRGLLTNQDCRILGF